MITNVDAFLAAALFREWKTRVALNMTGGCGWVGRDFGADIITKEVIILCIGGSEDADKLHPRAGQFYYFRYKTFIDMHIITGLESANPAQVVILAAFTFSD